MSKQFSSVSEMLRDIGTEVSNEIADDLDAAHPATVGAVECWLYLAERGIEVQIHDLKPFFEKTQKLERERLELLRSAD